MKDLRTRQCDGKVNYLTGADARYALVLLKRSEHLTPYLCYHCNHWHLGTRRGERTQEQLIHELEGKFSKVLNGHTQQNR